MNQRIVFNLSNPVFVPFVTFAVAFPSSAPSSGDAHVASIPPQ